MEKKGNLVTPTGESASAAAPVVTERSKARQQEDRDFVPVIIKRNDEIRHHPDDMLEHAILDGLEQHQRRSLSLLLSSVAAGLIVSFSVIAVGVVATLIPGDVSPLAQRAVIALVYPLGFVLVVMSGAQLYTEHTATAVYPVLEGKARGGSLVRLWSLVVVGNLMGTLLGSVLIVATDPVIGASPGYREIGEHLVSFPFGPLFLSATLAGWLMAQGSWLVHGTSPAFSQMACIYIVTFLIGIGGLHHSIVGSAEMFTAAFVSDAFTFRDSARFILIALVGNLVGGSIFVALLNYSHIRKTQNTRGNRSG